MRCRRSRSHTRAATEAAAGIARRIAEVLRTEGIDAVAVDTADRPEVVGFDARSGRERRVPRELARGRHRVPERNQAAPRRGRRGCSSSARCRGHPRTPAEVSLDAGARPHGGHRQRGRADQPRSRPRELTRPPGLPGAYDPDDCAQDSLRSASSASCPGPAISRRATSGTGTPSVLGSPGRAGPPPRARWPRCEIDGDVVTNESARARVVVDWSRSHGGGCLLGTSERPSTCSLRKLLVDSVVILGKPAAMVARRARREPRRVQVGLHAGTGSRNGWASWTASSVPRSPRALSRERVSRLLRPGSADGIGPHRLAYLTGHPARPSQTCSGARAWAGSTRRQSSPGPVRVRGMSSWRPAPPGPEEARRASARWRTSDPWPDDEHRGPAVASAMTI